MRTEARKIIAKLVFAGIFVLVLVGAVRGDIVALDLFDLGCQELYDFNSPSWTTDFDLGVTFEAISNVYMDWSGEIKAGLAVEGGYDDPFPLEVGIGAYLGSNPWPRTADVWGDRITYPEPEPFELRSEFWLGPWSSWSDLLDGRGRIIIQYKELIIIDGSYVEHGFVDLSSASLVVYGVTVPEPTTLLFIVIGAIVIRAKKT